MNKLLLLLVLIYISVTAFGQNNNNAYGPVPTKDIKNTIGETYVVIGIDKRDIPRGHSSIFEVETNKPLAAQYTGKTLKLLSLDDKHTALFADSAGKQYTIYKSGDYAIFDIMLLSDYQEARKLFLNKTLWLNDDEIWDADRLDDSAPRLKLKQVRFEPVVVQDIYFNSIDNRPLIFKVKTSKGQVGYVSTSVSGTNIDRLPNNLFYTHFYDKDPKTIYHFTPAVWQMVKSGGLPTRGMPMDAFILMMGRPTKINSSDLGTKVRTQLVYGDTDPSYYYFEGNKYVGRN